MNNAPLVSVITPSFNQGEFLEETILSVLNQTYKNIEYLIIDGGSSDNSIEIIKKYEKRIAFWLSEKDSGQADAINKGLRMAKGDFICWLNSDDILYPHFVATRIKNFSDHPGSGFIYGDVDQGWDVSKPVRRKGKQQTYAQMLSTCRVEVPQMSAMWTRNLAEQAGPLDTRLTVLLDWEYFLRMARLQPVLYQPGSVAFFRQHKDSKSITLNEKWAEELESYYKVHFEKHPMDFSASIKMNVYFYCAALMTEAGNHQKARHYRLLAKNTSLPVYLLKVLEKQFYRLGSSVKKRILN